MSAPPSSPSSRPPSSARRSLPAWLTHPLGWRSAPIPWTAALRGALSAGPLLALGLLTGHLSQAVLAGLGAMLAGVNDRPGTRRTGVVHIGLPAVGGALGLLCGGLLADADSRWTAVPALFVVGWLSGALSVTGPVWSAAAMQCLVTAAIGAGMPIPGPAWLKAVCYLGGAVWLLLLRFLLRAPRHIVRRGARREGEREAVAEVFDALADALHALGGPDAEPARRRLIAAQHRADESLRLMRLLPLPGRRGGRGSAQAHRVTERFAAATALCEAGIALLWEGRPLPRQVANAPRLLAVAVRADSAPGALASPVSDTVQRGAFDRALLAAAVTFDRTALREPPVPPMSSVPPMRPVPYEPTRPVRSSRASLNARSARRALKELTGPGALRTLGRAFAPARRENALRVALCVAASAAVALSLHQTHWYWLPATAAFLVKPDLGPLFSRVVNRVAGTATGVLVFTVLTLAMAGLGGLWWLVAVVVAGGALIPVATRHFGFQTAVVTLLVLSFVYAVGDTEATAARLLDTALACGIVLLVGHLPHLTDPRVRVGHRFAVALRGTERYLRHVLDTPRTDPRTDPGTGPRGTPAAPRGGDATGIALRYAAYRALSEARAAAETAAAELPGLHRAHRHDWLAVMARAERVVDAATVCAVRVEQGVPLPTATEARWVTGALAAMADALEGGRGTPMPTLPPVPKDCRSLRDVMTELHGIQSLTTVA
ncbi:FUSC family protein [Streptomyces sp. 35G-GA-8]|uniref:FUSC family protein n=1 Tax=Streptomyces sp. 35G-GA-8 TaxID=2939434 RepID=UPI00201F18BB|nr:FUSC family protein [Streptomyces sp. 35G-GA-8]MCL7377805.1 FUSC family protein [Streptomyces sp. 35G-GA-8]